MVTEMKEKWKTWSHSKKFFFPVIDRDVILATGAIILFTIFSLVSYAFFLRLWRQRQERAGAETDRDRARLAVESHLTRIVRYRPLESIADPEERETAARARAWYRKELLDALMD